MRILDIDGLERDCEEVTFDISVYRSIVTIQINEARDIIQLRAKEGLEYCVYVKSSTLYLLK